MTKSSYFFCSMTQPLQAPAFVCISSTCIYHLSQAFISDGNVVAPFNRLISSQNPQFLDLLLAVGNEVDFQQI